MFGVPYPNPLPMPTLNSLRQKLRHTGRERKRYELAMKYQLTTHARHREGREGGAQVTVAIPNL